MTRALFTLLLGTGLMLTAACGEEDSKLPEDTDTSSIDADGDGYDADMDCDDSDPEVHPGTDEVCDEVDNDCDGEVDEDVASRWYPDADGDGYGDEEQARDRCEQPTGYVEQGGDCDDGDADIHPGADERCDGIDNDCDGVADEDPTELWYVDADGDDYGNPDYAVNSCDPGEGWVSDATDCDDGEATIHPEADEACNGIDDDCDGTVDEGLASSWYEDADDDGYGDASSSVESCEPGDGWVAEGTDCDDADDNIHPDAGELCDGIDNDCDGLLDDADADIEDRQVWYFDGDADGYGLDGSTAEACFQPSGYAAVGGDCYDGDSAINPAATETCNGTDDDCDGLLDDADDSATGTSTWYLDYDADGYGATTITTTACDAPSHYVSDSTDCDDLDASAYPGGTEICDGADNDCDGSVDEPDATDATTWYADADADGWGDSGSSTVACTQPSGHVSDATDCDDGDAAVNPGATELCNGADDDCDGTADEGTAVDASTWYTDADGDGYGDPTSGSTSCAAPAGHVADATDCDDADGAVHPGADEFCNGTDDDCDGDVDEAGALDATTWYDDDDGDGYGDPSSGTAACSAPSHGVSDATDCDDSDGDVHPGADESCDGDDDDCDGSVDEAAVDASTWYADADADGYGSAVDTTTACDQPTGYLATGSDCDDWDASVNPAATELCDGIDNDCDGLTDDDDEDLSEWSTWYLDADGDGYGEASDTMDACDAPTGYVSNDEDCDDDDASIGACTCGDGLVDAGEEVDPDPGYTYITVDAACRWDFSSINQLYCNGGCTWAGSSDCDQSDADIFCKLLTDNPSSTASSWTNTTALDQHGFSCPGGGDEIDTDRGVSVSVYYLDSSILSSHGPGNVIAYPVCTDP